MSYIIHGQWGTRLYRVWWAMIQRCENPKTKQFHQYGGRGIRVCARWRASFAAFHEDMGDCPAGLTLDRWPNNDGNYEPGNCRWATRAEQQRNRCNNRVFEIRGVRGCLMDLVQRFGVAYSTVRHRLAIGWEPERAFTEPADQRMNHRHGR